MLDIGSNPVHLLVADAHPGARPLPAWSHRTTLRLAEHLEPDGAVAAEGVQRLEECVRKACEIADDQGAEETLALASAAFSVPLGAGRLPGTSCPATLPVRRTSQHCGSTSAGRWVASCGTSSSSARPIAS